MSFLASGIELQNGVLPNGIKIRACKNTVDFIVMQTKLVREQANRIEELEAVLREIGEKLTPDKYDNEECLKTYCGKLARDELEKKEGDLQ
jgi:hypothetical protein